ncbi:MAG: iron complex outermembrane receptor protein [Halioglobus sp.]|jgi:iron complex outermembrane receptor protein
MITIVNTPQPNSRHRLQKTSGLRWHSTAFALALTPVWALVGAPQAQGAVLEEVLVVARKREESLQDTPVAVSAFNADQMRAAQINNIADLTQQVPGLSNKDGEKVSGLTIRGVGARAVGAAVDPGVGVYVDGIFMPRSDTQLVDVVDMESIQVLRGPQGTLFGKNTAGGALLLSTKKPGEEFEGQVELGLGDYDRLNFSARFDGPLIADTLYGALTYDTRNEDGYMEDYFTGIDYGDKDRQAVVGQLRWFPVEELTVDLIALWGERDESAAPSTCINVNPDAVLQGFVSTTPGTFKENCALSESLVKDDKVVMDSTGLDYTVTNNLLGLTLGWDLGEVTLKSVTGYLHQDDLKRERDQEGTSYIAISNFGETTRQLQGSGIDASSEQRIFVSQEFNLFGSLFDGDLDYTLGVYGSDEEITDQIDGQTLALGGWMGVSIAGTDTISTLPAQVVGFRGAQLIDYTSTSAAAFGQLIYHFSDMLQFTLGGRFTWEEKKIDQRNYVSLAEPMGLITRDELTALSTFLQPVAINPDFPELHDEDSWTEFSPTGTITMFAPDTWTDGFLSSGMFYLTYSEGFKAGGFTTFGPDFPLAFDPEIVKNTEFGFKTELFDQRVRLNGAIYSMDYDDLQLGVTREFGELNTLFGITNAGSAEMQGAEVELVMLPLEGLMINFTASYIDASFKEFNDEFVNDAGEVELTDRSDEPFSYVPEQSYTWAIQYDWDTDIALITPRVSGYHKDEVYTGLDPAAFLFEEEATLDDYTVWNARIAIQPKAVEGLEIAIFVQNLTDEFFYGTGTIESARVGVSGNVRGKPRAFGVDMFYSF